MPKYVDNIDDLDFSKTYTYADYLLWRFKERVELYKGKIFKMSPAPSTSHQRTILSLTRIFDNYFQHHKCELFVAPFDVQLIPSEKSSVVQPDLCVVCDASQLDERGCHGAPNLVVEILSKGNSKKEIKNKYDLYEEAGVKEYWIVDYMRRTVLINVLNDQKVFQPQRLRTEGDQVTSTIFPELVCDVDAIFLGVEDQFREPEPMYGNRL